MPLKFQDPPARKGGPGKTATPAVTDEDMAELKNNPGKWALAAEGVTTAQKFAKWKAANNPADKNGKTEKYPWEYTARDTGKTKKNRNGVDAATYDVYVRYNPEGIS